ncbi:MAG: hypothetical protein HZA35_01855 [Parcubacteria group bacterium]|nr:hypothetical protein [Parcubacteria group bacterium]
MYKHYFIASTLLLGTIIGAGIFTLPQVFFRTGLILGFFYLLVFGVLTAYVHMMYAEVIVRTKEDHELAGYTELYLGKTLGRIIKITQVLGNAGTLVAYQILGAEFLRLIIPILPQYSETVLFWILGSVGVVFGVGVIAKGELLTNGFMFLIVIAMLVMGLPYLTTLTWHRGVTEPLLPYGVVLYALMGQQAVKEVILYLRKKKIPVRPITFVFASLFSVLFCAIFVFATLLLYRGAEPSLNVFGPLVSYLPIIGLLGGLLGFANILDSFWTIGTYFKEVLTSDLKLHNIIAIFFVLIIPLFGSMFLRGKLLWLLGILGGVFVGFEILIILFLWRRARELAGENGRTPDFSLSFPSVFFWIFVLFFGIGLLYKLIHIIG